VAQCLQKVNFAVRIQKASEKLRRGWKMTYYYVWVGGLKGVVQEKDLTETFQKYGTVRHIRVVRDQETQKSK